MLVALLLVGCAKNEIRLTFEVGGDVNSACRIMYYASSNTQGMVRETAVDIAGGKGAANLPTRYPSIIYLFSGSQSKPALAFYAERGDEIRITGKGPNVADWEVSGNKLTDEWNGWRMAHRKVLSSRDVAAINKAVKEYVDGHTDSRLSLVLLSFYYSRREDPEGFSRLYGKLKERAFSDKELLGALSSADLLEGPAIGWYVGKGGVKSSQKFVLRGEDGYADTLFLNDSLTTLIVFTGKDGFMTGVKDSIKSLLDVKKGKVAEVYLEPDTVAWQRHLRADSIPGLHRLMMPLGLADSTAISIGLDRTPYYFTVGPKGRLLYRGDDLSSAIAAFRK